MKTLAAVDFSIPVLGILFSLALFLAGLGSLAQGCLAGAVFVSLDWLLIRILFRQILKKGKAFSIPGILAVFLLGMKFIFLAVFIFLIIKYLRFDPYGMAIGIGALPLGIIAGTIVSTSGEGDKGNTSSNA